MTLQEAREAFKAGKTVRHEDWKGSAIVNSLDELSCYEPSITFQKGWEVVGEFKTVNIEAAREEIENKYRQALFMHRQYPYDQFKEGYYEGMQRLLDLLGIDYSDWQ